MPKTSLEESLLLLEQKAKSSALSLGEILEILAGKGKPLCLLFLALPFCLPIQIPGLSVPFGILIAIISLRIASGNHAFLPKKLLKKEIPSSTVQKIAHAALAMLKKIEPWVYPRFSWMNRSSPMRVINSLAIAFLGTILALPLPIPLSNMVAAWAILCFSLGFLKEDGLCTLLGYLFFLAILVFFTGIALSITLFT